MSCGTPAPLLDRNVRLYRWYTALFNAYCWAPVFFLYFSSILPLDRVLQLEAIYYISVVLLEVPSGYFSDRIGRRATLVLSATALVAAYIFFLAAGSFGILALAQVLLATGMALNSGTDVSFHYDSLASLDRAGEFEHREAVVARIGFISMALAALAGGALGMIDLRLAYGGSLAASVALLFVTLRLAEPIPHREVSPPRRGFGRQLVVCTAYLRVRELRWLFIFAVLMTVLHHVPYELYQPYFRLINAAWGSDQADSATPLATGVHTAAVMILGSWFAGRSVAWRRRLGLGWALLLAGLMQVGIIGIMGLVLHPVVIIVLLLRSSARGLVVAPMNAAIAPRVPADQRATYLSIQALAGRLSFAATLAGLSLLPEAHGDDEPIWTPISTMLLLCAGGGLIGLIGLALGRGCLRAAADDPV